MQKCGERDGNKYTMKKSNTNKTHWCTNMTTG